MGTVSGAWATASGGALAAGNVGGGTGMIGREFKGGTAAASRVVGTGGQRYTVGALVQANYGERALLRVDGVPVRSEEHTSELQSHLNIVCRLLLEKKKRN